MFQTRTGQTLAILSLLALSALPMKASASANEPSAPIIQAQSAALSSTHDTKPDFLSEQTLDALRHETKVKFSETTHWVKTQADLIEDAADRVQTRVAPAGEVLRTSFKTKIPGASLAHWADRTFSAFGLLLMMAFAFVVLLMGLSSPMSRLGGRH